jgi:AAA+ superfamily predicted ATPase
MIEAGVIGVFMSNLPEQLDPAFMSRMSAVIPFLPPANDAERASVLAAIIGKYGTKVSASEPWLLEQSARVLNWSGRDLEQVVRDALQTQKLDNVTLGEAIAETITYRRADVVNVVEQVRQALKVCKDSRLVPSAYRDLLAKLDAPAKPKAWNDTPAKRASAEVNLEDV